MQNPELKPCPFCGGIGFERFEEDFHADPQTMFIKPNKEKPIKEAKWNTRANTGGGEDHG